MEETAISRSSAPKRSLWRRFGQLIFLLALVYLGVAVLFVRLQRSLIYAASRGPVPIEMSELPASRIREVQVPAGDGLILNGWLTSPETATPEAQRYLVILFPGNAGNRAYRDGILDGFNQLGCAALICDYRGYADNPGSPSEEGIARDARAIWEFARQELDYPADRILLCGESLGGGVAVRLAWDLAREGIEPGGLILRTTFASLTETGSSLYPWLPVKTFLVDRYPSIDRIGEITCPILVIHGKQDQIVPFSQGEKLFQAAPAHSSTGVEKRFLILPEAGHNNVLLTSAVPIHQAHAKFLHDLQQAAQANSVEQP